MNIPYRYLNRYRYPIAVKMDTNICINILYVGDVYHRILEEMAVAVFAEQRGEDVLKKLLQVKIK